MQTMTADIFIESEQDSAVRSTEPSEQTAHIAPPAYHRIVFTGILQLRSVWVVIILFVTFLSTYGYYDRLSRAKVPNHAVGTAVRGETRYIRAAPVMLQLSVMQEQR